MDLNIKIDSKYSGALQKFLSLGYTVEGLLLERLDPILDEIEKEASKNFLETFNKADQATKDAIAGLLSSASMIVKS